MLPVLKKAGVVDAGGKGFVVLLEGMGSVIKNDAVITTAGETSEQPASAVSPSFFEDRHGFSGEISYTYCTEFLVRKTDTEKSALTLRAYLETIGDCVVVVDDDEIIKVHVHTDNPGSAMQEALGHGMLTSIKVENMREQFAHGVAQAEIRRAAAPTGPAYAKVDPGRDYGFVSVSAGEA
jgi:dihydroxyacetone kinase-like predicted kinase